jgi:hypothetical protein
MGVLIMEALDGSRAVWLGQGVRIHPVITVL